MMLSPAKKRKVTLGAIFGAISGAVLFAVLYFASDPNLGYAVLIPIASAVGAAQMYVSREE
jgi:hypothetical protein